MKKKKLDLSELKVESFATKGEPKERPGTVKAHGWGETWGEYCWDTQYDCPSAVNTDCWDCPSAGRTCTCQPGGDCTGAPWGCQWA